MLQTKQHFYKSSLRHKSRFTLLFKEGKSLSNASYFLKYLKLEIQELPQSPKWALCMSKKVIKASNRSVMKNKYKRITRVLLREIYPSIKDDFIFAIFPTFHFFNFNHLQKKEALQQLLSKAHLLK